MREEDFEAEVQARVQAILAQERGSRGTSASLKAGVRIQGVTKRKGILKTGGSSRTGPRVSWSLPAEAKGSSGGEEPATPRKEGAPEGEVSQSPPLASSGLPPPSPVFTLEDSSWGMLTPSGWDLPRG